jgi:hypothetical protein
MITAADKMECAERELRYAAASTGGWSIAAR